MKMAYWFIFVCITLCVVQSAHAILFQPPEFDRVIVVKTSSGSFDSTLGWTQYLYPGMVNTMPGNRASYGTDDGFSANTYSLSPQCDFDTNDYASALCNNEEIPNSRLATMYDDGACDGYGYGHLSTDVIRNLGYYDACALPATAFLANNYMVLDGYYGCYMAGPYSNRICGISGTTDRFTDMIDGDPDNVNVPGPNFSFSPSNITTVFDYADDAGVTSAYYYVGDLPFLSIFSDTVGGGQLFKYSDKMRNHQNFLTDIKGVDQNGVSTFPSITYVDLAFNFSVKNSISGVNIPENVLKRELLIYQTLWSIRLSPVWNKTIVLVVPDHSGGYFDHVAPFFVEDTYAESFDMDGTSTMSGFRLPAIIMSPFARHKVASGGPYDHSSVVNMISDRWDLGIPSYRNVSSLINAFDFSSLHLRKVTFEPDEPVKGTEDYKEVADHAPIDDLEWLSRSVNGGCTTHIDICGVCGGDSTTCAVPKKANIVEEVIAPYFGYACPFLDASALSRGAKENDDMIQKMKESIEMGCTSCAFVTKLLGLPGSHDPSKNSSSTECNLFDMQLPQPTIIRSDTHNVPKSKLEIQMESIKKMQGIPV